MARIRTIKPEFWDSEDTASASLRARLLYIAMWNMADDYGIGDATPIRMLSFAFPHDDLKVSEVPTLCGEISERFGVVFYRHEGRAYFYIPSFDKHQRTEKKAKQRVPFPHNLENPEIAVFASNSDGTSDGSVGKTPTGTGEQGNRGNRNRGTGEEHSVTDVTAVPASAVTARDDPEPDRFDDFWNAYPRKVSKGQARKAWKPATKKASQDLIVAASYAFAEWCRHEETEQRFIAHPATWLNGERWNDEPPVRQERRTNLQQHLELVRELGDDPTTTLRQIGPA